MCGVSKRINIVPQLCTAGPACRGWRPQVSGTFQEGSICFRNERGLVWFCTIDEFAGEEWRLVIPSTTETWKTRFLVHFELLEFVARICRATLFCGTTKTPPWQLARMTCTRQLRRTEFAKQHIQLRHRFFFFFFFYRAAPILCLIPIQKEIYVFPFLPFSLFPSFHLSFASHMASLNHWSIQITLCVASNVTSTVKFEYACRWFPQLVQSHQ